MCIGNGRGLLKPQSLPPGTDYLQSGHTPPKPIQKLHHPEIEFKHLDQSGTVSSKLPESLLFTIAGPDAHEHIKTEMRPMLEMLVQKPLVCLYISFEME